MSARTIARGIAEGHLLSRRPLRALQITPDHHRLRLKWCRSRPYWTASEWNQVVFREESRLIFCCDGNSVRVWRLYGERLNPAFGLQRQTAHKPGLTVRGVITYTLVTSNIDRRHLNSPPISSGHPVIPATCVDTHGSASRNHFSIG